MHLSRYSFRISEFYWIFTIDDFENLCRDITNLNHNDFKIQTEGGQMTKAELIEKMGVSHGFRMLGSMEFLMKLKKALRLE